MNSLPVLLNCEKGELDCLLLQQNIEHVSIVYTCNTYFVMHKSMLFFGGQPFSAL